MENFLCYLQTAGNEEVQEETAWASACHEPAAVAFCPPSLPSAPLRLKPRAEDVDVDVIVYDRGVIEEFPFLCCCSCPSPISVSTALR